MQEFDLNSISVKSPCAVPWETMTGDERTRFCGQCKLNVFNLSGMNRAEAEEIIRNKEGRLCVRYVKRADGTILTKDCAPIRAAKLRRAAALAIAAILILGVNLALFLSRDEAHLASSDTESPNGATGRDAFGRIRQSKVYHSSPPVKAIVDWTENAAYDPPNYPNIEAMGYF